MKYTVIIELEDGKLASRIAPNDHIVALGMLRATERLILAAMLEAREVVVLEPEETPHD